MFGIGQINWGQFTQGILWYLSPILLWFFKRNSWNRKSIYEDMGSVHPKDLPTVPTITHSNFYQS
jgi:hypothetical protein